MLQIFLDAPLAVQVHLIAALEALCLGPLVLWRRRRDRLHKMLGYVWVCNMTIAAVSSFFIHGEFAIIGPFGPIHALSVWSLYIMWSAIAAARAGDMARHSGLMQGLYHYGVLVAALMTVLPGRRINGMLFGENESLGLWLIASVAVAIGLRVGLRQWQSMTHA